MELTEATQAEPAKREMPAVPDTLKARTTALQARFADKAEYARTGWVVTVPDGDDLHERLSDPLYWMYCASKFNVGDRLEIRNESFTHWGDYLVTAVDHIAMSVDIQCIKAIKIQQPEQIDHGTKFYSTAHEGLTDQSLT